MKFSQVTFAVLLIMVTALCGFMGYLVWCETEQAKLVCLNLAYKVAALEQEKLAQPPVVQTIQEIQPTIINTATSAQLWANLQKNIQNTVVQLFVQKAAFHWLEPYKVPEVGVC